jgi:hypothetical protein
MLLHVRLVDKLLLTNSTKIGLLPRVRTQMPCQLVLVKVRFGAHMTQILLHSDGHFHVADSMNLLLMYAHDVLVFVLFFADVAHVRPVIGVGAKMLLQHALVDEFLVAQVARKGPLVFVATHVCVIIRLDRKSLRAQLADVLPQTGVGVDDQFVRAQVFVRVEALGTVLALVFSFVQVGLLVYRQVTFRDVTLAAIGANVGATAVVVFQVLQQIGRTRESVVANVTNERFDSFRFGMMYLH